MSKFKKQKRRLSQQDYEFMHSLSAAILQVAPSKFRIVLYFWIGAFSLFLVWANFAYIDEIARGEGEIIPSGENQIVQNLEGGIVEQIMVKEGDSVKAGEILLRIDNQKSESSLSSNEIKAHALEAKIARLQAEANGKDFVVSKELKEAAPMIVDYENNLYKTNQENLNSRTQSFKEQKKQKEQELSEARTQLKHLKSSYTMISKEVKMTKPMVDKGVRSKIDFLKLQREANDIESKYKTTEQSIPRLQAAIKEVNNKIEEVALTYRSDAQTKLNEAIAEFRTIQANSTALEDEVTRTIVKAPIQGIVKKLYVNTIGGVIKPGADILEIVPSEQALLVNVRVKPSDIAFIYYGQKAIVKFTAYDFAIYGGLEGKVVLISPDTQKDQKENVYYIVQIKTEKNFLGSEAKPLKIIPGMTVNVDIITGKKTVLDYILKPILRAKQYTFSER
ncbi:HlyD family type I secretion periplasmic adaptor subunit [Sulfurimonas sp.]|uniref:HlyD family type I secretion periplasmic adaptor subunit n=1 Tax=Sulfurimonas sp. TaxID=2022749 RepID=UPI003D0EFE93